MEENTFVDSEEIPLDEFIHATQQKINQYAHLNNAESLDETIDYWVKTFQEIDKNSPGMFCLINPWKFGYFFVSDGVRSTFGLDTDKLVQEGVKASLPVFIEDHRVILMKHVFPALHETLFQATEEGKAGHLQIQYQTKCITTTGEKKWFTHNISVVKTAEDGTPEVLLKVINDIDNLKSSDWVGFKASYVHEYEEEVIMEKRYILKEADIDISDRELQILLKISEGLGTKQIADQLFISENTVKNHRANMLKKTNSTNCSQLIKAASQIGLL